MMEFFVHFFHEVLCLDTGESAKWGAFLKKRLSLIVGDERGWRKKRKEGRSLPGGSDVFLSFSFSNLVVDGSQ